METEYYEIIWLLSRVDWLDFSASEGDIIVISSLHCEDCFACRWQIYRASLDKYASSERLLNTYIQIEGLDESGHCLSEG